MKNTRTGIRASRVGGVLRIEIHGEIDHHTAKLIREEIDRQIYALTPKEVNLSLAGVGCMDSSGLGLVVGRLVTAKEVGCTMTLTGVAPRTMRIFEMAGLERMRGLTIKTSDEKRKSE